MYIRECTSQDLITFRPAIGDLLEMKALGKTSLVDLTYSDCLAIISEDNFILAIGGNIEEKCWFLTSELAFTLSTKHKLQFRALILKHSNNLFKTYKYLWNYVWSGNIKHIRFLKTIGAKFYDNYDQIYNSHVFKLFIIHKKGE